MMNRSGGKDSSSSSESCKNSGNSNSHNISGSRSGSQNGNGCSSSSESSCGQGVHVRNRSKWHGDLRCRFFSSRNVATRKCCKHSAFKVGGTRNTYCHILKESACHQKKMQSRNFSSHIGDFSIIREEDDQNCSLKKQRCQHWPAKFSNCLFTRYLPSNCCDGSCYVSVVEQETDELTRGYCNQRKSLCSVRRWHDNCGHCHHHYDHEAPPCQQHLIRTEIDCRSNCFKEIPNLCAFMNAGLENLAPMGVHGLFKGDFRNESTINRTSSAAEPLKAHDKSWLTLHLARPPKPVIADFNIDDISLGLPVNTPFQTDKQTQDIDLNVRAEDHSESSIDMCAPSILSYRNSELQMVESAQDFVNDKGATSLKAFGCWRHLNQGDSVILEDSDDECLQKTEQMDVLGNEIEDIMQKGNVLLSSKKGMTESVDVCTVHVIVANKSSGCEGENVERNGTQSDKSETVAAVEKSDCALCESNKETNISAQSSTAAEHSRMMVLDSCMETVQPDLKGVPLRGFKPRKKRMIDKKSLPLLDTDEIDDGADASNATLNTTITVQKAVLSKIVDAKSQMWESGILCDLCQKGPCLSLGEWYAWCCGLPLNRCGCSSDVKMRLTLAITYKKSNRPKKTDGIPLSGKVHKMCALWSSEVYEEGEGLQGLCDAVKRGKLLICAGCKEYGATLGCRVKACRRSFHYPCADELASKLCCRMWDGVQHPVACRGHRHVPETCTNAKERPPNLRKWLFRGFVSRKGQNSAVESTLKADQSQSLARSGFQEQSRSVLYSPQPKLVDPSAKIKCVEISKTVIDISTDSEGENKTRIQNSGTQCNRHESSSSAVGGGSESNDFPYKNDDLNKPESRQCWSKDTSVPLYHMGTNLLCEDITCGREAVLIPCTNDVDSDPAPVVNYITENRYLGRAKSILDSLLLDKTRAAPTCISCSINGIDDPNLEPSVHAALVNSQRESDTRFDWQGQSMLGRVPYDRFGRLQFGPDTKDILECNSRCPCGVNCLNKELQKGIRLKLEVFKTKERGWGVRTMEQICRGRFVVEYVGEVLTHDEAHVRGIQYDLSNLSCLFSADHPDVPAEDLLVIDGFGMSNVARFINHSCDGNLRVYRVYTETTDLRFCRIGLYALRDIEIGEELSYDYSYVTCKDTDSKDFSSDPTSIRCVCGASNCRQWLWTGTSR